MNTQIIERVPSKKAIAASAMILSLASLTSGVAHSQQSECSIEQLKPQIAETRKAVALANAKTGERKVIGREACKETSASDAERIKKGLLGALKGVMKGKVPDPFTTVFKLTFSPSQIGTASQLCPVYGLHDEEKLAAQRIDQLFRDIDASRCAVTLPFQLAVIEAIGSPR